MKGILPKFFLGFIGLIVGASLAEGLARSFRPIGGADLLFNAPDASPMGLYVLADSLRVIPASNFQSEIRSLDYSATLRTNEIGLRGPPTEQITDPQWLALGDSFTMAVQVSERESFAGELGQQNAVHVWNAGVDGYSTFQAALRARQIQNQLPIERIILTFFTGNDFQDNERFWAMQRNPLPGPVGSPIPRESVPLLTGFLLRHSHLYAHYRIYKRQKVIQSGQDHSKENWKDELQIFTTSGQGRLKQLRQRTREALKALKKEAGERPLMVAIAPPAFVIDIDRMKATFSLVGLDPESAKLESPQQAILEELIQQNIPHCDLSTALKVGQQQDNMYFEFDGHWTPAGHQIVAKQIGQCMETQ